MTRWLGLGFTWLAPGWTGLIAHLWFVCMPEASPAALPETFPVGCSLGFRADLGYSTACRRCSRRTRSRCRSTASGLSACRLKGQCWCRRRRDRFDACFLPDVRLAPRATIGPGPVGRAACAFVATSWSPRLSLRLPCFGLAGTSCRPAVRSSRGGRCAEQCGCGGVGRSVRLGVALGTEGIRRWTDAGGDRLRVDVR